MQRLVRLIVDYTHPLFDSFLPHYTLFFPKHPFLRHTFFSNLSIIVRGMHRSHTLLTTWRTCLCSYATLETKLHSFTNRAANTGLSMDLRHVSSTLNVDRYWGQINPNRCEFPRDITTEMGPVYIGYIAQWLERLTADQQVPGSNPGVPCFFASLCLQSCLGFQISGHPESNQGPSDCCIHLQSDALPTEL